MDSVEEPLGRVDEVVVELLPLPALPWCPHAALAVSCMTVVAATARPTLLMRIIPPLRTRRLIGVSDKAYKKSWAKDVALPIRESSQRDRKVLGLQGIFAPSPCSAMS